MTLSAFLNSVLEHPFRIHLKREIHALILRQLFEWSFNYMFKKNLLIAGAHVVAVAMSLMIASQAHAADLKIGYVDLKVAIENTKRYQNGFTRLEALKQKKKSELDAIRKRIDQVESDIMGQSMAMSPERLSKKQADLKDLRKSFTRKQQDAGEELVAKKNALDTDVLVNFYKLVRAYGKENKYDMLLQKSSMFYADPKFDVTSKITELLDKKK